MYYVCCYVFSSLVPRTQGFGKGGRRFGFALFHDMNAPIKQYRTCITVYQMHQCTIQGLSQKIFVTKAICRTITAFTRRMRMENVVQTGIDAAIAAAGSQDVLARMLGCSQQNVSFWKSQGYVPNLRAVEIEQLTGVARTRLVDPRLLDLIVPPTL